jgi:putative toxin-antitoxin system antitoxin component (TIGR02293 family)
MAQRQHTAEKARRLKRAVLAAKSTLERHAERARTRSKSVNSSVLSADPIEKLEKDMREFRASAETRGTFVGKGQVSISSERNWQKAESSSLQEISDLLGGHRILESTVESELDAHGLLRRGLPRRAVTSLVEKLHVIPVSEVSEALGVSLRTLQRHKSAPVALLDVQQSGRAWKFAEILAKATRVLGSQEEAEQWLKRPAIGLDQQRPVNLLTTPAGVKLVEDYLGRLEYDIYT